MKKVEICGRKFTLRNRKEVPYGAHKEVEDLKFGGSIAMMTNNDIIEMMKGKSNGDNTEEITEENLMDRLAKGDIKEVLMNSQKAALPIAVEAIMLSAGLTRDEIYDMPVEMVDELAKVAEEELGGLLDFTKTSTTDTT